jgi:hypothetical protein
MVLNVLAVAYFMYPLPLMSQQPEMQMNGDVSYNEENHVRFETVRAPNGIPHVRLHGIRDGVPFSWDLINPTNPSEPFIPPPIREIRYANGDRIWIVSEMRGGGAYLLDLAAKKIEKRSHGYRVSLSPDLRHVAYLEKVGDRQDAVFVDDMLVYPSIEEGFTTVVFGIPAKANRTPIWRFVSEDPTRRLISSIQWSNDAAITFTVEENWLFAELTKKQYPAQKVKYVISGITNSQGQLTADRIHIARSLVTDGKETTPTVLTSYSWPTTPSQKALEAKVFPEWFNTGPLLQKGETVSFDNKNSLTVEELAQNEVRLGVVRDGIPSPPYVFRLPSPNDPISSQISQIAYANKNEIWLISRFIWNRAGIGEFDLNSRTFVRRYWGRGFSFSPDRQHIAFAFPYTAWHFTYQMGIFVDNTIVYPSVHTGFSTNWISTAAGEKLFYESFEQAPVGRLASSIWWKDNSTVEFVVVENWLAAELLADETRQRYILCTVSGLGSPSGPGEIHLQKSPLTKEAFLERIGKR